MIGMIACLLTCVLSASSALAGFFDRPKTGCGVNPLSYHFMIGGHPAILFDSHVNDAPMDYNYIDDPAITARALRAKFLDPENPQIGMHVLYIDFGDEKVIFDASLSPVLRGELNEQLDGAGIDRKSITRVYLTHAHLDHIGGTILNRLGFLSFPEAKVYLSKTEHDYWTTEPVDHFNSTIPEEDLHMFAWSAKTALSVLKSRVETFELGSEVMPGIVSVPTTWHTPGHTSFNITLGGSPSVFFAGDALGIVALSIENPWFRNRVDSFPEQGVVSRYALLDQLAAEQALIIPYHARFPGIGQVTPLGPLQFSWVPWQWLGSTKVVAQGECTVGA